MHAHYTELLGGSVLEFGNEWLALRGVNNITYVGLRSGQYLRGLQWTCKIRFTRREVRFSMVYLSISLCRGQLYATRRH